MYRGYVSVCCFISLFWLFPESVPVGKHLIEPDSVVCAGGAQRPEAQQHPLRGRERERRVHQDLRLWFRQTAESRERPAHDAVLHRQLCRTRGTSWSFLTPCPEMFLYPDLSKENKQIKIKSEVRSRFCVLSPACQIVGMFSQVAVY